MLSLFQRAAHADGFHGPPFKSCGKTWKLIKKDWSNDPALLAEARDYMAHCEGEMDRPQRVRLLGQMGRALIKSGQHSEAIPILRECTRMSYGLNGDLASCWELLGEAAAGLGACDAAAIAYNQALQVPTTDNLSSDSHKLAEISLRSPQYSAGSKCSSFAKPLGRVSDTQEAHKFGSAFYISAAGHLLTNNHVVDDCKALTLGTGVRAQILSRDPKSDLALLKVSATPEHFVKFRSGDPLRLGETVMAFGFPFPGTLSSDGVATSGIVSSLSGIRDDPRTFQFSAAVQPGNSGGPLFDSGGQVVGVVEGKLGALKTAGETDPIPENVGFAIQWAEIKAFLDLENVVPFRQRPSGDLLPSDLAAFAQQVTVSVNCTLSSAETD